MIKFRDAFNKEARMDFSLELLHLLLGADDIEAIFKEAVAGNVFSNDILRELEGEALEINDISLNKIEERNKKLRAFRDKILKLAEE